MVTLEEKNICYNKGYLLEYINYIKNLYYRDRFYSEGLLPQDKTIEQIENFIIRYKKFSSLPEHAHYCDCSRRLYKARKEKIRRIRKKLKILLSMGPCLFCTFTWSDESLEKLSPKTRRRYVTEFARSQSLLFLGNIDFNGEHHREHYHFIIQKEFIPSGSWSYGFDHYEKIKLNLNNYDDTVSKVGKYLNKLVNHSVKIPTGCNSVIYSNRLVDLCVLPSNYIKEYNKDGSISFTTIKIEELSEEDSKIIDDIF